MDYSGKNKKTLRKKTPRNKPSKHNLDMAVFLASCQELQVCKNIIKSADKSFINFIGELALNLLQGNIDCQKKYLESLAKRKSIIRQLASKRSSSKIRRSICIKYPSLILLLLRATKIYLKTHFMSK